MALLCKWEKCSSVSASGKTCVHVRCVLRNNALDTRIFCSVKYIYIYIEREKDYFHSSNSGLKWIRIVLLVFDVSFFFRRKRKNSRMQVCFYEEIERDCIALQAGLPQRKFAYDNRTGYDARANIMRMHRKVHFLSSDLK